MGSKTEHLFSSAPTVQIADQADARNLPIRPYNETISRMLEYAVATMIFHFSVKGSCLYNWVRWSDISFGQASAKMNATTCRDQLSMFLFVDIVFGFILFSEYLSYLASSS